MRKALRARSLTLWEAFTAFDADDNGVLSPAEVYGAFRWLKLPDLTAEDVVDFVEAAAPAAPERTRVTGGGLHGGVVGSLLTVRVALYDALDNRVVLPADHHNVTMTVLSGDFSSVVRELPVSVTIPTVAAGDVTDRTVTEGVGSWKPETPGTYNLRVLTGAAEVDGSPFELQVTPAAAPVAISATLAAHGAAVVVAFDVDARDASFASSGGGASSCAALLDASTVGMLGADPQCTWATARELVIRYGANATLTPADAVQVGYGLSVVSLSIHLLRQCQSSVSAEYTLTYTPHLLRPTISNGWFQSHALCSLLRMAP